MMSPDGRWVVTGGTRANRAYIIDVATLSLVKSIPVDFGPEHLAISPDGRYYYQGNPDGDSVSVIDLVTQSKIHDGKYAVVVNNGDETVSFIDTQKNEVVATYPAGPDMVGVNFAAGKAFVISSTSGFLYVFDMASLTPAGRIKIGANLQIETATTDTAGEKIYLGCSTNHSIYVIDGRSEQVTRVANVGLFPWGTHILDSQDNYCH